jgi:hypothetical protein
VALEKWARIRKTAKGRKFFRPLFFFARFDGTELARRSSGWCGRGRKHFADGIIPMLLCETLAISCDDNLSLGVSTRYQLDTSKLWGESS